MKPEKKNMQTQNNFAALAATNIINRSLIALIFLFATHGAIFAQGGSSETYHTLSPSAGEGAYTAVYPDTDWQAQHPACTLSASMNEDGTVLHVIVSGGGDCVPVSSEDIGVVDIRKKDGTLHGSYLITTPDGGTTILAINIE